MKKYRKALKKTGALKKLYKEKYGNDMTSEKLANFKEALQFVVGNNDNPGTVSKSVSKSIYAFLFAILAIARCVKCFYLKIFNLCLIRRLIAYQMNSPVH